MTRRNEPQQPVLIAHQRELDQLVEQCGSNGRFAFDTEFVMEDRYESEVCLIQVALENSVSIIDPFLKLELGAFWALIADDRVEKVVHAGQEDLAISVQNTSAAPRRVFDTQLASGLVGPDYPLSLQRLVQMMLHVRLHKSKTLTDWRKRPLTAEQISYASEDVSYLLAVHQKLHDRLAQKKRLAWALEEFAHFEDLTLYRRAEEDRLLRIKGAGSLRGQELIILQALFRYRDEFARRVNRPARVILKDHLMIEIARQGMTKFADIRDLRGINLSDREVQNVCKVVSDALAVPQRDWPQSKPNEVEAPWEASVLALATGVIRAYCLDNDLAYSLAATQKSIRELVRFRTGSIKKQPNEIELLHGWRGLTVGRLLDEVLNGTRGVRVQVDKTAGELRLTAD